MSENNTETTLTERANISRRITELKPNAILVLADLGLTVEVHSAEWPKLADARDGAEYALGVSDGDPYARSLESGEKDTITRLTIKREGADPEHASADSGNDQIAPDGGETDGPQTVTELGQSVMDALANEGVDTNEVSAFPRNDNICLEYGSRAIADEIVNALDSAGFQFDHREQFRSLTITGRVMTDGGIPENEGEGEDADPRDLFSPQRVSSDLAMKVKVALAKSGISASEFFIQEHGDVVEVQFADHTVQDPLDVSREVQDGDHITAKLESEQDHPQVSTDHLQVAGTVTDTELESSGEWMAVRVQVTPAGELAPYLLESEREDAESAWTPWRVHEWAPEQDTLNYSYHYRGTTDTMMLRTTRTTRANKPGQIILADGGEVRTDEWPDEPPEKPRYCRTEDCFREPTVCYMWGDETSGEVVQGWSCKPCYNAMEYGSITIPSGNLQKFVDGENR